MVRNFFIGLYAYLSMQNVIKMFHVLPVAYSDFNICGNICTLANTHTHTHTHTSAAILAAPKPYCVHFK